MKPLIVAAVLLTAIAAAAEVAPVATRVPDPVGWVGQRVPFYVDLHAPGSFAGTASFSLPQVPGTLVIKIGEPVVETEQVDGRTWFVQRHEFALFSQKSGTIEIPPFDVRFSRREGYSGPSTDVEARAEGLAFEIKRPPGSERIGFLVTTEDLEITETWEPAPGPAKVGDVFKRTIIQRAPQMTGIALAPVPEADIAGVRVYPGEATTHDQLARGAFLGERSETITYLVQQPGIIELPAISYVWWNPRAETLESKTLPAVTCDVAAPPEKAAAKEPTTFRKVLGPSLVVLLAIGLLAWQRKHLAAWTKQCWSKLNPPDRVAARRLIRACRANDAAAAGSAWALWRSTQPSAFVPDPTLQSALVTMQRQRFGPENATEWQGSDLAHAFRATLSRRGSSHWHLRGSDLPTLNPRSPVTDELQ